MSVLPGVHPDVTRRSQAQKHTNVAGFQINAAASYWLPPFQRHSSARTLTASSRRGFDGRIQPPSVELADGGLEAGAHLPVAENRVGVAGPVIPPNWPQTDRGSWRVVRESGGPRSLGRQKGPQCEAYAGLPLWDNEAQLGGCLRSRN